MSNRQFPTASFAAANIARLFDAAEISELGAAHETANGIACDQQIDHGAELKLARATRPTTGGNYLELVDLPVGVGGMTTPLQASEHTLDEGRAWYARLASAALSRPTPGGNYLEDYDASSNSWV